MFTGLVQDVGKISSMTRRKAEAELVVATSLAPLDLGESIAVMGACLSVTSTDRGSFTAFASEETLAKTGLDSLSPGDQVNLERALRIGDPIGGHLVSGHVDTRVEVLERVSVGGADRFGFGLPDGPLARQLAPKGSVALDGVSLTINDVLADRFEVMVIPITLEHTTLVRLRPGGKVNLETDALAKYVARQLDGESTTTGGVDLELLTRSGFVR